MWLPTVRFYGCLIGEGTHWGGNVARVRILLADDHKEIRERAVRLLEPEFEVVGAVADGYALVKASAQLLPDVCVIDISMPHLSGIEAAIQLRENRSQAKIVFLTVNEDSDFVSAALRAGAMGYVVKSRMASDLCVAVNDAINGNLFVSPSCIFSVDPDLLKPLP
ncbi:MAG TPA: response regulator transcription factor [Pyrinomonadaceae bacterium]|nr:response regulator transcription factor [Pyrinomonadaceae bacterium]